MKAANIARITVAGLVAVALSPLLAQQKPPSWTAITPGSIRAAGSPGGPLPPPHIGHGHHHHPRPLGYDYGYAVPYWAPYGYVQPDQPAEPAQPVAPAEPEQPGLTIFEHNGRAIDQAVPAPPPSKEVQTPPTTAVEPPQEERPGVPTILVFRDGHQQQVLNYAIIGDKLIILNQERANRIPLAELDLDATRKANDEQGIEFRLPGRG